MSVAVSSAKTTGTHQFRRDDGRKHRVLYAEDQATARVVTTALLERMGFDVEAVEDGELAFEKAKLNAYDVILLDIEMPVMDGVTAARHIRAEAKPCRETPILALSAFLADSTEHSVWRDAFDSALPKPANSNELQIAMHKALGARNSASSAPSKTDHWDMLSTHLPAGTLAILVKAAAKEMQHLCLAYGSCVEAGDLETAAHCKKALRGVATSFSIRPILQLLDSEKPDAKSDTAQLMQAIAQWHLQIH
jgi:CheY-like chemotaxis protein